MWWGEWNKTCGNNFYTCMMKQIRSTSYVSESSLVFHIFVVPYDNKLVWRGLRRGKEKGIHRTGSKQSRIWVCKTACGEVKVQVRSDNTTRSNMIQSLKTLKVSIPVLSELYNSLGLQTLFFSRKQNLCDIVNSLTPNMANLITLKCRNPQAVSKVRAVFHPIKLNIF